jgi:hypothetical protein
MERFKWSDDALITTGSKRGHSTGARTSLVGEGVILVGDHQDGGNKHQISTPVSAFSAIVGVLLNCVL